MITALMGSGSRAMSGIIFICALILLFFLMFICYKYLQVIMNKI